jgi:hypothetical protein
MRHPRLRRAIAVALSVWLTLLGLDRISAYVVNGPKWSTSAVPYLVNPTGDLWSFTTKPKGRPR